MLAMRRFCFEHGRRFAQRAAAKGFHLLVAARRFRLSSSGVEH
ncbi:MAG: hypothetical protein WKF74_17260 [Pyrinomonadaceae bacterium]